MRGYDDDRIGHGGFESPSGRQWWQRSLEFAGRDIPFSPRPIGYFQFNFEAGIERFINLRMLEDFTDSDDQDWIDFNWINKQTNP